MLSRCRASSSTTSTRSSLRTFASSRCMTSPAVAWPLQRIPIAPRSRLPASSRDRGDVYRMCRVCGGASAVEHAAPGVIGQFCLAGSRSAGIHAPRVPSRSARRAWHASCARVAQDLGETRSSRDDVRLLPVLSRRVVSGAAAEGLCAAPWRRVAAISSTFSAVGSGALADITLATSSSPLSVRRGNLSVRLLSRRISTVIRRRQRPIARDRQPDAVPPYLRACAVGLSERSKYSAARSRCRAAVAATNRRLRSRLLSTNVTEPWSVHLIAFDSRS